MSDLLVWTDSSWNWMGKFDLNRTSSNLFSQQDESFMGFKIVANEPTLQTVSPTSFFWTKEEEHPESVIVFCKDEEQRSEWVKILAECIRGLGKRKNTFRLSRSFHSPRLDAVTPSNTKEVDSLTSLDALASDSSGRGSLSAVSDSPSRSENRKEQEIISSEIGIFSPRNTPKILQPMRPPTIDEDYASFLHEELMSATGKQYQ
eukprot:TRINITY_DN1094_c0_g1_i1.p1 TRINITY_DN1094_c0_g1~~TRINITY_DN1094_c0_g1_i1.p1  ORF type:complete len:204 (-),score=34.11 TRINITY_DN1094_c0_g1_i1:335-946(-)